jgi:hypothetical protein
MVAHTYNLSTQEGEKGRSQVWGHDLVSLGYTAETLLPPTKKSSKKENQK